MKRGMSFVAVAAVLGFSAGALAEQAPFTCTNGTIDKVGDAYFEVQILEDGLQINPYESSIPIDSSEVSQSGNVYSILNKKILASAEGEEFETKVNAFLIFNRSEGTMNVAISYDEAPFTTYQLTCVGG